jgi:nickel transport protein
MNAARIAATLLACLGGRAAAHDTWIERDAEGLVLRSGHRGAEVVPVELAHLKGLRCVSGGATRDVSQGATPSGGAVRVAARCDVLVGALDHGYYVLTPDGERNVPRTQAPDAVKAWRARQWAKWVDARSPAASVPLGDGLELVPVTDLARAHTGEKVTVRVLLDGKPVAGVVVAIGHAALAETGASGEARVKVRHDVESISATLRRPLHGPEAESDVLEASLTFEVAR